MLKKVISHLDFSKTLILRNAEPEFLYILADLSNMCLIESCFPDCWKVSSLILVFKNVGERSVAKNYHPNRLLLLTVNLYLVYWLSSQT